jgi:hypothetical protein
MLFSRLKQTVCPAICRKCKPGRAYFVYCKKQEWHERDFQEEEMKKRVQMG